MFYEVRLIQQAFPANIHISIDKCARYAQIRLISSLNHLFSINDTIGDIKAKIYDVSYYICCCFFACSERFTLSCQEIQIW